MVVKAIFHIFMKCNKTELSRLYSNKSEEKPPLLVPICQTNTIDVSLVP